MSEQRPEMREGPFDGDAAKAKADRAEEYQRLAEEEEIRLRAHQLYVERGSADGGEVDDWLQAEREYRDRRTEGTGGREDERRMR